MYIKTSNTTVLGFANEQSMAVARVPTFNDWGNFLALVISLLPGTPIGLINATYHPAQRVLLFNIEFAHQFDPVIPSLVFDKDLSPLGYILHYF